MHDVLPSVTCDGKKLKQVSTFGRIVSPASKGDHFKTAYSIVRKVCNDEESDHCNVRKVRKKRK